MKRLVVVALALAGCGTTEDERPQTLEYITTTILQPSCGAAQCHSSFRRAEDYVFDTVEEARATFARSELIKLGEEPEASLLYKVLVSPGGDGYDARMPYDQPLADVDVELIYNWISNGAVGL